MHAGPEKSDDEKNKETLVIVPEAYNNDLQQQNGAKEGNILERLQVKIDEIESQAEPKKNSRPLPRFQRIHRNSGRGIPAAARPAAHISGEKF
jgi:hypothetical protein